jgi:nitrogen fixation/metabolism regulation signal transduction histidine kinase
MRRWRSVGALPAAALLVGLFVALDLMSDAVQRSEELSRAFVPLLFLVLAGLAALVATVAVNVVSLVRQYRERAAGSRLTARMVVLFALISLLPVGVVYYFSLGFLLRGIDAWFDVEIDRAMQDALTLNQASLDLNQRVLSKYAEQILAGIEDRSATALALTLSDLREQAGALELTVFGPSGQVYGTANEDPSKLVADQPDREILQGVRTSKNYVALETDASDDLVVRALVADPRGRPLTLQAIFPTSERITELASRLENAYNRYRELAYLRQSIKVSFSLTLSLVLVAGLLAALIAAFHTARRLVEPVADIARGTRAVAEGDYEQQLPQPKHDDELAFLVASFNTMTRRIAQASEAANRSQEAVESQRAYLETLLGRLSSGVMVFDTGQRLRTANPAARQILQLDLSDDEAPTLASLEHDHPRLSRWIEAVHQHLNAPHDWRAEVTLFGGEGRQILMCRGSPLPEPEAQGRSHVVVFDDVTTLVMAQRDAAWGEVARRLAHEIKNPLTPIQLSAERLRHKLLAKLPEADAGLLDRATRTIVQQVEAMKAMVNDFSNYARTPTTQTEPVVFDRLVCEVLDLYRSAGGEVALRVSLKAPEARIMGDPLRLRQVVHNLVKNAQEAMEGRPGGEIRVGTTLIAEAEGPMIELCLEDDGPGIEPDMLGRLFEPYVTTKVKGTGLGLAIVKKIIEEHGGIIQAENRTRGACITARLPVWQGDPDNPAPRHEATQQATLGPEPKPNTAQAQEDAI